MIAWEATVVALLGAAAGIVPGMRLAHALARGSSGHGIAPAGFRVGDPGWRRAGVVIGSIALALVQSCRRATRSPRVTDARPHGGSRWNRDWSAPDG